VLAGVLVLATVAGWAAVAIVPTLGWVVGVAPTVLLTSVLVLGRRAVLAGREADADWEARIAEERRVAGAPRTGAQRAVATAAARASGTSAAAEPVASAPAAEARRESTLPFVTGRAVHPSDASTEVFERIVEDKGETGGPVRHATGAIPVVRRGALPDPVAKAAMTTASDATEDEAWSPVPVPRPTYTMKADAPRREPAPLENLEGSTAARTATAADAPAGSDGERAPLEAPVETTGSIDLNAVLAKRRAAGE